MFSHQSEEVVRRLSDTQGPVLDSPVRDTELTGKVGFGKASLCDKIIDCHAVPPKSNFLSCFVAFFPNIVNAIRTFYFIFGCLTDLK